MAVYDFSAFGTNENIGDTTISLKRYEYIYFRILNILRTEGKYEMAPTMIPISNPNFPDKERGNILL